MRVPETKPTVLVLTALALEYAAVRPYIAGREDRTHPGNGTFVEVGHLPGTPWQVACAELGEGARNTAALTASLIGWLRPEAVLFVGVAGSLKEDVALGDVVVGTKVYGVHGGKQTPEGLLLRPEAWSGSHALLSAARTAVRDLSGVRTHFKPIATADVLLADAGAEIARHVREHYNDAAAFEMEGAGAAHAAHVENRQALVVRGISDRANAEKSVADAGGSQERAAARAAAVAVAVLRTYRPRGGSHDDAGEEHPGRQGGDHIEFRGGTFYGPVVGKQVGGEPW
ncbi:5'-methylthioadenosine/S-adenosylhomocysteine nucleosidase [Streptomyces naphthomycinicus]|uniref:5'-methylthioadenosine/S-adenosylhomocysteine nucleosidase family protein n=1 Tax=Streptomyces naphthomycinicus TaxID=2872625 RepID=UPI001CED1404|nr:5'-methylthioadenosine/S-adenosylhomocysteine nucleosidase [Streptomyces sp. TML10]